MENQEQWQQICDLGTPTVLVSSLAEHSGNFRELSEKYKLVYFFDSDIEGYNKAKELFLDLHSKEKWKKSRHIDKR